MKMHTNNQYLTDFSLLFIYCVTVIHNTVDQIYSTIRPGNMKQNKILNSLEIIGIVKKSNCNWADKVGFYKCNIYTYLASDSCLC